VRLIKLRKAAEHLLVDRRSAAQLSATPGFADESGFRRSFRTGIGMTPTGYVSRHRP
jgi:AraC-like DNA-binding protein